MNSKFSNIPGQKVPAKAKWSFCVKIFIIYLIPYIIVNHLPLHRYTLPFIFGEELIPFLPWTFIFYFSSYLQSIIAIRHMPDLLLRKVILVLGSTVILGLLMFILFPIKFPRELYLSDNPIVKNFHLIDTAGNCFPSLHVLLAVVFAYTYSLTERSNRKIGLMWIWTALITFSVLTTKQHYLVDIFGGMAFAVVTIFILKRYINHSKGTF